jgi:hypothetical protein
MNARIQRTFLLRVVPEPKGRYLLSLEQRPTGRTETEPKAIVTLGGDPLSASLETVLQALREAGQKPSELRRDRKVPFEVSETIGVRLGLLFLAVKPLRKPSRMEDLARGIRAMTDEESYYWFGKVTAKGQARRAQKALRLLLSEE